MPIAISPDLSRQYQVLDPCLLGRPVHLLPQFAERFGAALGAAIATPAFRRYWSGYRLDGVEFGQAPQAPLRWLGVSGPHGRAAAAFERVLLLGLLQGRYGRRSAAPAAVGDPAAERVTATEERLATVLTQQLAEILAARVNDALAANGVAAPAAPLSPAAPVAAPGKAGWTIRIALREPRSGATGCCWIALDQNLMASVLAGLRPEQARTRALRSAEPLASSLQVRLDGRLLSKEITLAALFDMQVGDVIPVSVGRADVLLDESRLFTASVAEHKGKLCLTSFEDAE
jgi:flagellar motor switch protein FliM